MKILSPTFLLVVLLLASCNTSAPETEATNSVPDSLASVPDSWVNERVAKAQQRLNTSEVGKLVWQAIEAHGGLNRWFSNGPLAFQFNYQPLDGNTPRNTYEVADYWSARTRHERIDTLGEYGWTGKQAWVRPADANVPYNTRFWSLTPYYFVGIPFVLADEGINFELLGEQTYQERIYDEVKITFGENVGDAPDDYYVVYIDKETKQVDVTRYIVSYPGYFPDGGRTPEKFMEWTGHQTIDGITLATGFNTHWWKDEQPAERITEIEVSRVAFKPDVTNAYFEAPSDAQILTDL